MFRKILCICTLGMVAWSNPRTAAAKAAARRDRAHARLLEDLHRR